MTYIPDCQIFCSCTPEDCPSFSECQTEKNDAARRVAILLNETGNSFRKVTPAAQVLYDLADEWDPDILPF